MKFHKNFRFANEMKVMNYHLSSITLNLIIAQLENMSIYY